MRVFEYQNVTDAVALRDWLRAACLFLSVVATAAATAVFCVATASTAGIAVTWLALFPAFWIALRFISLIVWDTSFKAGTVLRIAASARQVSVAWLTFAALATIGHSYAVALAFAAGTWSAGGALLFLAIPAYLGVSFAALIAGYLPILLGVKLLIRD